MGFDTMTYALLKKKIVELEESLVDKGFKCKLVDQLPEVGELNIVYLIKLQSEEKDNYYEEYVYLDGKWEKLGATQIDLTNVATKEELENLVAQQFSGSWNDLEDKPFGEEKVLVTSEDDRSLIFSYDSNEHPNSSTPSLFSGFVSIESDYTVGTLKYDKLYRLNVKFKKSGEVVSCDFINYDNETNIQFTSEDGIVSVFVEDWEYLRVSFSEVPDNAIIDTGNGWYKVEAIGYITDPSIISTIDDEYISDNIARVSDVNNKADKAEVYTKTEVDKKVMIRYCGERYDMESLDPEHGFGASYGDVYNILDANGYVDVNGKKLYGSTSVVCTRSKDGDLGWAEFDINDLLNACRREDIVFKRSGIWDSLESLKEAVENNDFWPELGDVHQINNAFVDMYGNAREWGYVVYAQDPSTHEYGWAVFDISTLANTYTRAEIDRKNYISKAELQNILNQIKLNVAEDGTISINIPTIS